MSTINQLTNNSYYSLNNQSTSNSAATDSATQLKQALAAAQTTGQPADSSYLLNLSAEAQAYIKSLAAAQQTTSSTQQTSQPSNTSSFVLSRAQQKTIDSILAKYKDAPYNEGTFKAIQADLDDAGLSAQTLGAQEMVRSFNATQFLLDALNGTDSSNQSSPLDTLMGNGSEDETAISDKYYNFMSNVVDRWKAVSTTAAEAEDGKVSANV